MAGENIEKLMHDICPFRIGQRVRVSPNYKFEEWLDGVFVVVSLDWEYQKGDGHPINIGIASDDEITARLGATDGFSPDDLIPA